MRLTGFLALTALMAMAQNPSAARLAKQAEKAERDGQVVEAYLLYARAAVANRLHPAYWAKAEALRPRAEAMSAGRLNTPELAAPKPAENGIVGTFTAADLRDLDRLQSPARLRPSGAVKSFHLKGEAKPLYEQVAREFGYVVIFDHEFNPAGTVRFDIENADYRDTLHALEAATGSFIIPVSETVMLVASDSTQKRTDLESNEARAIPIPQRTSQQEAQELLAMVQQTFDVRRVALDPQRRMILLRDRVSKVEAAAALLAQLSTGRPQVAIDVDFISTAQSSSLSLGIRLPSSFPLVDFGSVLHSNPFVPAGFMRFLTFGAGKTFMGIGITDAQLFATAARSSSKTLLSTTIQAGDGQPATAHFGSKYPIVTGGYFPSGNVAGGGGTGGGGTTYAVISTTPYADIVSAPVTTTGSMELIVNGTKIPLTVPAALNNLTGIQQLINSYQTGVYASVVQRGTTKKPISLVLVASTLGVSSIELFDDPAGANIQLTKLADTFSAISGEFADATKAAVSKNGSLSLAIGSGTPAAITLASDKNNLNGLRDAINAAKAGIKAAVLLSNALTGAVYLQVVADQAGTGAVRIYDDPSGTNTALLTPTDEVNQAGSQLGQTVTGTGSAVSNIGQIYTPPPTFTFEDLGLVMKITPTIHNAEEVSLEIEAEFKVLGNDSFNGIPVIATRKYQGKVRLLNSEWAVIAGLTSDTRSDSITGIPGLMHVPGLGFALRDNERTRNQESLLIVIKPHITSLPANEYATRPLWVGTETRPLSIL